MESCWNAIFWHNLLVAATEEVKDCCYLPRVLPQKIAQVQVSRTSEVELPEEVGRVDILC